MTSHPLAPPVTFGLGFDDFYDREGLSRLDAAFVAWLKDASIDLHARLMAARATPEALAVKDESNLLIELARPLEDFIGMLFGVGEQVASLRGRHSRLAPLYDCKRLFVQRYVTRAIKPDTAAALDGASVTARIKLGAELSAGLEEWELAFALAVRDLVGAEFKVETPTPEITAFAEYAAWALHHPEGKKRHRDGPLFKVPHKLDFEHLVPIETETVDGVIRMKLPRPLLRHREGFALTDQGFDLVRTLDQANYCIWCHNQGKDSCSRGLRDRKTGAFQKSPFGVTLVGDQLYVANTDAILRFPYVEGETKIAGEGTVLTPLPGGPIDHHWTKSLTASPDGKLLYVGVGSNSNITENGIQAEKDRAAIWEVDPSSRRHRVLASGLRNPVGMAFEPETKALWVAVNERDELGSDLVPDFMTAVQDGGFYGWPYSYYGRHVDARVQPARPDLVAQAIVPDYALGPHTASLGPAFSRPGALPAAFSEGAFVGQHGSWNRSERSGYKVIFVPFADGRPSGAPEDVLTGFLDQDGKARGRPVGAAVDATGALLVADDVGNVIWRVVAGQGAPAN